MALHPKFNPLSEAEGLDVIDPVETRHFSLFTSRAVDPTPADPDAFTFPVDAACAISTDRLRFPYMIPVDVRTPDGDPLASIDSQTTREFSDDDYLLELHSPIKVYLRVPGGFSIEATAESVSLAFDEATVVEVGARSYHSDPAATITVPDDPDAMMAAVSAFASALKTTSPERAWPTLRGHPPRVERGGELSIPEGLEPPDTGIRITIPSEYWAVYTVAPLAYYLGAEVVPGDSARVSAESGAAHHLGDDPAEVGDAVEALLKRVFFLDCVTRTEGLYPDELHERAVLESRVDLDLSGLYDAAPADRLAEYLAVPDDAVEAIESPWHRVTHVQPTPESVELLPYVVNDLALVRAKTADDEPPDRSEDHEEIEDALDTFLRRPTAGGATAGGASADGAAVEDEPADGAIADGDFVRSAGTRSPRLRRSDGLADDREEGDSEAGDPENRDRNAAGGVPEVDEYVSLPDADALQQAWVGDGTPIHGTKLIREAFARETPEPSDGTIEITVVCNDEEMREEWDTVGQIYGSRDDMRTSVDCEFGVSTDRLRELFAEDRDVFHFIGHIDGQGFQCPDGVLDAAALEETNATAALLNGCRSHDQGVELVKAGASAAIVSLSDLYNSGAVEVGETLAGLLHHGFDIGSAMRIVRDYTSIGDRYVVLGDPGVVVTHCEHLFPTIYHISDQNNEGADLIVEPYSHPVRGYGIGSTFKPITFESRRYYLAVGGYGKIQTTSDELQQSIGGTPDLLIVDGELVWSDAWFAKQ